MLAARHAQASAVGGADFYGEEHILHDFKAHLVREQVPIGLIDAMLKASTLPDFKKRVPPLEDVQAAALAAAPEPHQATEKAYSDEEDLALLDGVPTPVGAPTAEGDGPVEPSEVVAAVAEQAVAPVPHGYVVSLTKRGKCRRLHFLRDCWLVPGHHYKEFEIWGERLPAEADITCVCSHCMPLGRHDAELGLALDSGEQSSSSSGDEGPAPKKARVGTSSDDDGSSASS